MTRPNCRTFVGPVDAIACQVKRPMMQASLTQHRSFSLSLAGVVCVVVSGPLPESRGGG